MKKSIFLSVILFLAFFIQLNAEVNSSKLLKVNYKSLVSRADLDYSTPVIRSEEGMPIGNGRMGSLVWTTPDAMHFQK